MTKRSPAPHQAHRTNDCCSHDSVPDVSTPETGKGLSRRSGRRLWPILGILLLVVGCSQNTERIGKNDAVPPPPPPLGNRFAESAPEQSEAERLVKGTPPGLSGEVRLSPEMEDKVSPDAALFIFARKPGGGPIAAKRLSNPEFPVRFFLGQESVMFAGEEMSGSVDIEARVSQTGAAGPPEPGDLWGDSDDNPIKVGDSRVYEIIIDAEQ